MAAAGASHQQMEGQSVRWVRCRMSLHAPSRPSLTAACRDLIHPHHDNELAQSQAAACSCDREAMPGGQDFVRHWMHVGFVNGKDHAS